MWFIRTTACIFLNAWLLVTGLSLVRYYGTGCCNQVRSFQQPSQCMYAVLFDSNTCVLAVLDHSRIQQSLSRVIHIKTDKRTAEAYHTQFHVGRLTTLSSYVDVYIVVSIFDKIIPIFNVFKFKYSCLYEYIVLLFMPAVQRSRYVYISMDNITFDNSRLIGSHYLNARSNCLLPVSQPTVIKVSTWISSN